MWQWHQRLSGPLPNGRLSRVSVGCRLGWNLSPCPRKRKVASPSKLLFIYYCFAIFSEVGFICNTLVISDHSKVKYVKETRLLSIIPSQKYHSAAQRFKLGAAVVVVHAPAIWIVGTTRITTLSFWGGRESLLVCNHYSYNEKILSISFVLHICYKIKTEYRECAIETINVLPTSLSINRWQGLKKRDCWTTGGCAIVVWIYPTPRSLRSRNTGSPRHPTGANRTVMSLSAFNRQISASLYTHISIHCFLGICQKKLPVHNLILNFLFFCSFDVRNERLKYGDIRLNSDFVSISITIISK